MTFAPLDPPLTLREKNAGASPAGDRDFATLRETPWSLPFPAVPDDLHKLVSKDIRPLVKKALKAGWTLERIGAARTSYGAQLRSPGGFETIQLPRQGGMENRLGNAARKALRRHGIV